MNLATACAVSRVPLAALLALALAACGILPKKTEIAIYDPQPRNLADPAWPAVRAQLSLLRPSADRLHDSSRIVVRPVPGELQVYKGAVWVKPAPDIVQDALLRALEDSGKLAGVTRRGGGIAADYDLAIDIRRFEADYQGGAAPSAVIELSASLIDNDANRIVGHRSFRAATPAAGTAIPEVSRAFERSLAQVVRELGGWSLQSMQGAR